MIKEKREIYNLGGLGDLFTDKLRAATDCIDEKELVQRMDKFLFGEEIEVPPNLYEYVNSYWFENFRYYTDIISSFERIFHCHAFLCKFPRFRYYNFYQITQFSWLRYHIEYYLNENYILRERTISWADFLKDKAKRKSKEDIKKALIKMKKIFNKAFKRMSRVRGSHVHVFRFEPNDFAICDSLDFYVRIGRTKYMKLLRSLRLNEISVEWKRDINQHVKFLIKIYDKAFEYLKEALISLE